MRSYIQGSGLKHPENHSELHEIALAALAQNNIADAIQLMRQAAETAPEIILYRRNLGELLRRTGQLDQAIASHKMVISIQPHSAENHFLLGLAYNTNHQFELAIQHYHIALSYDKNYGVAWNNLGASLESLGDKHQAKIAYATAVQLNPKHIEAQNNLGVIYSEEGRLNEARAHFETAIAANPDFVDAHYNLSLIKTYTPDDTHLTFLESIASKMQHYSIEARIRYYFALGKALDDTKQYTRAFKAYAEGNRLHFSLNPWNNTKLREIVEHIPHIFTSSFLKQPAKTKETRCPIFIVGMPRSGTTLIEQILSSHEDIYGAGELSILDEVIQEACHAAQLSFNTWITQVTDQEFIILGEKYLERTWKLAPDKNFIIDKMPANSFYIGMIYRMFSKVKIIHAIRDPMDSCFSCFTHLFKHGMAFAYDLAALGSYYELYAKTMQYWQGVLPQMTIFNLPYEQMVDNYENVSKQLIEYIGLPWDSNCLNFYKNKRIVKTASLTQVRKPIYKTSVQRWRYFTNELQPLMRMIALVHSDLGEMHRRLKAIDSSIQCGQSAAELDPDSATIWSNLGIAYYDAKQYSQAEECHKRALAINPKQSCSLNNMGSICKINGKTTEAIEFYQAAIAASPQFAESFNNLGVIFLQQQEFTQAFDYLQRALILAPTFADAHCNMGLTLLGLEQCDDALIHFENTLQLKPDYAEAYYGIAKLHLLKHEFTESEYYIRKAIALNAQQVEFYRVLADIYNEQGDHEQALKYLDAALSIDDTLASLHISKGNVLMEAGRISEAESQFSNVTQDIVIDTRVLAHYCLVQLRKTTENSPSVKALLSIADNISEVSPNKQEYLYFSLGKCFDDLGDWPKAFDYFTQGCKLKRKRITYNIAEQFQLTEKLIQCFNKNTIEYLRAFANPSALPIFIVGMPRSGTTLVEQIISSHPDVYGAGELKYLNTLIQQPVKNRETKIYYPENIQHLSSENCRAITDKYLFYLQRLSPNAMRITDKMPHNFIAIGLIHALFPHAKIIHVKRNPMDTCLSCYTKLFSHGQNYSYDLTELGQYYTCYERIMNHWRDILPPNAWLDIEYEDVVQNLETEAKRLIEFCDLTWEPACLAFHQSKRQVRTASFMQVRQPVYASSVERWRRFERELAPYWGHFGFERQ